MNMSRSSLTLLLLVGVASFVYFTLFPALGNQLHVARVWWRHQLLDQAVDAPTSEHVQPYCLIPAEIEFLQERVRDSYVSAVKGGKTIDSSYRRQSRVGAVFALIVTSLAAICLLLQRRGDATSLKQGPTK